MRVMVIVKASKESEAGALPAGSLFIILGFAEPEVRDVVYLEGLTGDLFLDEEADVESYKATYRTLVRSAAGPDATREAILAAAEGVTRHG